MRTIKVLETATELLDEFMSLPDSAYVVFENDNHVGLSGEGTQDLSVEGVTQEDVIKELFRRASVKVHIT